MTQDSLQPMISEAISGSVNVLLGCLLHSLADKANGGSILR